MDEPSAALSGPDTARLHQIIRTLTKAVKSSARLALLARGARAGRHGQRSSRWQARSTKPAAQETEATLIRAMLGRPLDAAFPTSRHTGRRFPRAVGARAERARSNRVSLQVPRGGDRRAGPPGRVGTKRAGTRDLRHRPPPGRGGRARGGRRSQHQFQPAPRPGHDPEIAQGAGPALSAGVRERHALAIHRLQSAWSRHRRSERAAASRA